jgi:hypothetical protein
MRTAPLLATLSAVALAIGSRPAASEEPDAYARLMAAKAPTVVSVKSVLKVNWGGSDRESNDERIGVVVDPSGVVMMQGFSIGGQAKVSATQIRVLFDGEEKEYAAVLGATDSKLGLAFVRVKDLEGRTPPHVDFAAGAEPKLGDELFGVYRTDQGFDYAPYFGTGRIVGQVSKPRNMWLITGFSPVGHPLYSHAGHAVGVVVRQVGISEEGSSSRTCLLPAKAVSASVAQAVKASAKVLEETKANEAEAAADAKAAEAAGSQPESPAMGDETPAMGGEPTPR